MSNLVNFVIAVRDKLDKAMGRGEGYIRNFLMKKEQQLGSLQVFMVLLARPENILLLKVALETGEICTKGN